MGNFLCLLGFSLYILYIESTGGKPVEKQYTPKDKFI